MAVAGTSKHVTGLSIKQKVCFVPTLNGFGLCINNQTLWLVEILRPQLADGFGSLMIAAAVDHFTS